MKHIYPGDREFTFSEYGSLPYEYVLQAYENGLKSAQQGYHMREMPVALLSSIFANANRDHKKKREPYKVDEFFFFQEAENKNVPSSVFGAAAMEMVKQDVFPRWALFAYKALKESANGNPPPVLAYVGEDVLVLAPNTVGGTLNGMVIAQESSYGSERKLVGSDGKVVKVAVPKYTGKYYAQENISMQIL